MLLSFRNFTVHFDRGHGGLQHAPCLKEYIQSKLRHVETVIMTVFQSLVFATF